MNIIEKVKEITKEMVGADMVIDDDTLLQEIGMNSISFIRVVVELENEFDIEFDDNELGKFDTSTVATLATYVQSQI